MFKANHRFFIDVDFTCIINIKFYVDNDSVNVISAKK